VFRLAKIVPVDPMRSGYHVSCHFGIDIGRVINVVKRCKEPKIVILEKEHVTKIARFFLKYKPLESCAYLIFEYFPPYLIAYDWYPVEEYLTRSSTHFKISSEELIKVVRLTRKLEAETGTKFLGVRCHYHNGTLDMLSIGDEEELEQRDRLLKCNIEGIFCDSTRMLSFYKYKKGRVLKMPSLIIDVEPDEIMSISAHIERF
jgi:hypothetical protein